MTRKSDFRPFMELTERDFRWFYLANAGSYYDKTLNFYPFKARFLKRFGNCDGWDSQEVDHLCWTCDGTGSFGSGLNAQTCRSCGGDGVHHTNFHWLHRYELGGRIYHVPEPPPFLLKVKNEIEGLIKHEPIDERTARRAFMRLLVRHEPGTFYQMLLDSARNKISQHWWSVRMKLVRLRNKMDLFPVVEVKDEVPF